jgi:hypothetical protein
VMRAGMTQPLRQPRLRRTTADVDKVRHWEEERPKF